MNLNRDHIDRAGSLARRALPLAAVLAVVAIAAGTWIATRSADAAPGPRARAQIVASASAASDVPAVAAPAAPVAHGAKDTPAAKKTRGKQLEGKLNINTATAKQLTMLPGIGPSKAERVVSWRTKNGPFKRVKDLRRVKGFGYKTLAKLEPYLTVSGQTTLAAR